MILDGHLHIQDVVHERADFIDLENRGFRIEHQLHLGHVPTVRVEGVEEFAIAADTARKPDAESRAVRGRDRHQRSPVRIVGVVVAIAQRFQRDLVLDHPAPAIGDRFNLRARSVPHVFTGLLAPVPVGDGADRIDIPAQQPEIVPFGQILNGADLQFGMVVPEHTVQGMHQRVGIASARLEPRVDRIDRR